MWDNFGFILFIYRYKMDITFGSSYKFACYSNLVLQFGYSNMALGGRYRGAQNDDISIIYAWRHAVAVDLQPKRIRKYFVDLLTVHKLGYLAGLAVTNAAADLYKRHALAFQLSL